MDRLVTTPSASPSILQFHHGDYLIHMKDDGYNYLDIFTQLDTIQITAQGFNIWNKKHQVFKFTYDGRDFVAKIDPETPKYFENKLWEILTGSFYSKQMKDVHKALQSGCTSVPDIYLVAERKKNFVRCESIIIMEYAPGDSFCTYDGNFDAYKELILRAMEDIHTHGLALGDANCSNFIINGETCTILDLSWHGSALLGQAKDRTIIERLYGWKIPSRTLPDKLAEGYIRLKRTIQHKLSRRKRMRPNR